MNNILFNLLIYPIVYILELIFSLVYQMIGSAGYSVIAVSIIVSIMVLPMYIRSDAMQEKERDEQNRLSHWVKHIRRTFKGDERFMILQEYYRQNHYHPLYVLRGSLSMLLEVPFFIAAYYFLSHLALLQGTSFHIIRDLGAPDALISIGSISINVLPILMTLINFVSGAIYTKGFPLKDKLQLYGLAVLFLVLLYDSPSGLVIYWTMNNLFSLGKNICLKVMQHPERDLSILTSAAGVFFLLYMYIRGKLYDRERVVFSIIVLAVCFAPLAVYIIKRKRQYSQKYSSTRISNNISKNSRLELILGGVLLTLLYGVVIPGSIISSSPTDFISVYEAASPLRLVAQTCLVFLGLFLIWTNIIYQISTDKVKVILPTVYWLLAVVSIINYFVFPLPKVVLSTDLVATGYEPEPRQRILLNLSLTIICVIIAIHLNRKNIKLVLSMLSISCIVLLIMSLNYIKETNTKLKGEMAAQVIEETLPEDGVIHLTKSGKNVIVFMVDRAVSGYLPYIFAEKPELADTYDGFTYYPNCLSYGIHTNFGAPPLFGGYEYTPVAMNDRKGMTIAEKHNEALRVLPKMFSDEGFDITICDPPYAGYKEIADFSIYDGIDHLRGIHLSGAILPDNYSNMVALHDAYRKHSFLTFSIYATAPCPFRWWIYDMGGYRGTRRFTDGSSSEEMIREYTELASLSELSVAKDEYPDQLFIIDSNLTHTPEPLQLPDYTMPLLIDNRLYYDEWLQQFDESKIRMQEGFVGIGGFKSHFQINAAAIRLIGNWLDWLKREGVYDNTRIIIVADHGIDAGQFPEMLMGDDLDVQGFNPLLLVKDFDAHGFSTSNQFMTNADVPSIAIDGIILNRHNPFTGKVIDSKMKNEDQFVTNSAHYETKWGTNEQFDTSDGRWFKVHDNIFDKNNWEEVD